LDAQLITLAFFKLGNPRQELASLLNHPNIPMQSSQHPLRNTLLD
jgi:hypothetical protein